MWGYWDWYLNQNWFVFSSSSFHFGLRPPTIVRPLGHQTQKKSNNKINKRTNKNEHCVSFWTNFTGFFFSSFFFYVSYQFTHSEQSIIGARASVMVYDDNQKKWIPSGTSSGLSKVHIYHHQQNNTFRVVGRKLQDHEVVINCSILKGLKYNQATPTFHQWRDSKFVYGLNFSSPQDAEAFARAMLHALEVSDKQFSTKTNDNKKVFSSFFFY